MRSYLIVDDNRDMAENLAEIIRDRGDVAVVATSGPEALALVQAQRFDAILTDMRMPIMDGAQLVQEVRRLDPGIPAIVITAFFKDDGIKAAQRQAPLAVLPKPVPMPQLLHLLDVAKRGGRIILVEHDPFVSESLTELLRARGFAVAQLESPDEIARLPPERPLLAIVDLRASPGLPPPSAVQGLRDMFPDLTVLVAIARPDADATVGVEPAHLFTEPLPTAALLATIERVYETRRAAPAP